MKPSGAVGSAGARCGRWVEQPVAPRAVGLDSGAERCGVRQELLPR